MKRRATLKRVGTALAGGVAAGLAGCSDNGNQSDDGGDGAPEKELPGMGRVSENSVDGLEITDGEPVIDGDNLEIHITVKNTGEQTTIHTNYNYDVELYDDDGEVLPYTVTMWYDYEKEDIAPGESAPVKIDPQNEEFDPEALADFAVSVECESPHTDVYCEE